jgi:hypothetical protein
MEIKYKSMEALLYVGFLVFYFFFTNVQIEEQYIYAVMENSEKNNGWLQFCKEEI